MPTSSFIKKSLYACAFICVSFSSFGQIYNEKFGKNRLQFEKKKWHYVKTNYFDVYYTDSTDKMAQFIGFIAERELPAIEKQMGYQLPQRVEILLYNSFNDYLSANLGKSFTWQESDGIAPVINGKVALYYDGSQQNLARQIKLGIINFIYRRYIYRDMTGDPERDVKDQRMPAWLSIGYIAYKAENWNSSIDDQLRNLMLNAEYKSFDDFLYKHPLLAAHAFWYYIELIKGKEGVAALMNFLEVTQSVKQSFKILYSKKDKEVKQDFMSYMQELYDQEGEEREAAPEGDQLLSEQENLQTTYYNFTVSPEEDNRSYAYARYKKGVTDVVFVDEDGDENVILSLGYVFKRSINFKTMPALAWSNDGDQLAVAYPFEQKVKILLYNTHNRYKGRSFILDKVDLVQSIKFDFQDNKLILSAFRNGQSDIYIYHLGRNKLYQITNDPYDDIDPSPIIFSNKTGIIYSSNRPLSGTTKDDESKIYTPANNYNICTVDDWIEGDFRTINKITNLSDGDALSPTQYNSHYYSFISDINGIRNRYLGRVYNFNVKAKRLTVIKGQEFIDISEEEKQKQLAKLNADAIDTSYSIGATQDSSSIFPISNYTSSIYESSTSGRGGRIIQAYYDGDYKTVYAIEPEAGISESRLPPLAFSRYIQSQHNPLPSISIPISYAPFPDTSNRALFMVPAYPRPLSDASYSPSLLNRVEEKLYSYKNELQGIEVFKYRLKRFQTSFYAGLETGFFTDKLQPYAGGSGPIYSSNGSSIGLNTILSVSDIAEDYQAFIGFRFGLDNIDFTDLFGQIELSFGFNNYKRRIDWGVGYKLSQRTMQDAFSVFARTLSDLYIPIKQLANYFSVHAEYPLDVLRSIRLSTELRNEQYIYLENPVLVFQFPQDYPKENKSRSTIISRLEWVYDNTFSKVTNISEGLKYKVYLDWLVPVQDNTDFAASGNIDPNIINIGADARYYLPVYKEMTFAARAGIDMSFGDKKILYYLGGADGWFLPRFNEQTKPSTQEQYSYQALAVNLRGFRQNAANGSSALALNFELRIPTSTFTNQYIRSLFLRNIQLNVFTDIGTAWNDFGEIGRPFYTVTEGPVSLKRVIGGIGPFVGGYGTGIRLKFLGQYMKFDVAWNYDSFFRESPIFYFSLGFDF